MLAAQLRFHEPSGLVIHPFGIGVAAKVDFERSEGDQAGGVRRMLDSRFDSQRFQALGKRGVGERVFAQPLISTRKVHTQRAVFFGRPFRLRPALVDAERALELHDRGDVVPAKSVHRPEGVEALRVTEIVLPENAEARGRGRRRQRGGLIEFSEVAEQHREIVRGLRVFG